MCSSVLAVDLFQKGSGSHRLAHIKMQGLEGSDSHRLVCIRIQELVKRQTRDFPGGAVVKNPLANAGDTGSIPGLGRSHMLRSN